MTQVQWMKRVIKPLAFVAALLPLGLLVWHGLNGELSANPISDITNETGTWTLRYVLITLSVTPLRRITGWTGLQRLRRMFGLFAFFYGSLHFMTYLSLDQFFDFNSILLDIPKRPFITVGFTAFVLMIPLAATSMDRTAKWMGGKRWRRLHRLVYATAIAGVIHYLWLVKADTRPPLLYAAILAVLLGYRIWIYVRPRFAQLRLTSRKEAEPA
jgi:sulfoxide reductase heme-binding subunit YedZ